MNKQELNQLLVYGITDKQIEQEARHAEYKAINQEAGEEARYNRLVRRYISNTKQPETCNS